jgi:serine/threonine protein kinase
MHPQSLHDYIKTHSPLPLRKVQDFTRDLMRALAYLHRRRIMHRDVKPSNLLISDKGLRLCDFGQAKIKLPQSHSHSPEISTLFYRAPEVLLGGKEYDEKVDMWAAGCVVGEMLLGEYLFKANS